MIFFSNPARKTFSRILIDAATGLRSGEVEVAVGGLAGLADLEIVVDDGVDDGDAGVAYMYVCTTVLHPALKVDLEGDETETVAELQGPTSVR